jgi:hypothetical protein
MFGFTWFLLEIRFKSFILRPFTTCHTMNGKGQHS